MENEDLKKLRKLVDAGYDVRIGAGNERMKVYIGRTPVQQDERECDVGIASMF